MSLKETLQNNMKQAMKERAQTEVITLRSLLAEIQKLELEKKGTLTEEEEIAILNRMAMQRKESIEQFKKASRQDLVEKEEAELALIIPYLPAQLSKEEVEIIISQTLEEIGATAMKDMGQAMGTLKAKLHGKTDMGKVSQQVRALLNQ